jgi:hypothetical protein
VEQEQIEQEDSAANGKLVKLEKLKENEQCLERQSVK